MSCYAIGNTTDGLLWGEYVRVFASKHERHLWLVEHGPPARACSREEAIAVLISKGKPGERAINRQEAIRQILAGLRDQPGE